MAAIVKSRFPEKRSRRFVCGSRTSRPNRSASLVIRPATDADCGAINRLATVATRDLLGPFLTSEQQAETHVFTPLDPWLIEDGTYFVAEIDGVIRASGGWSFREPMIRNPNLTSAPSSRGTASRARIRAMYTEPQSARHGIGRAMLSVCEMSARLSGHQQLELIATPVGELLYRACGFEKTGTVELTTPNGTAIQAARMVKNFRNHRPGV